MRLTGDIVAKLLDVCSMLKNHHVSKLEEVVVGPDVELMWVEDKTGSILPASREVHPVVAKIDI